jgi:hypothetical protein
MKTNNKIIWLLASLLIVAGACNDELEREPLSAITPESFFTTDTQLGDYTIDLYSDVMRLGNYGIFARDGGTDNNAGVGSNVRFVPGQWLVPQNDGEWSFNTIFKSNYFFDQVLPKWKDGNITGPNTDHYIGEMYFIRAFAYFDKLQELGDFPIIRKTLPDQMEVLIDASKRAPRNEVARFILSDLDSAILLMNENSPDGKNVRLSKDVARLVKSRVALYEGTWLKYFKGTAFVPNGPGWPGKEKDYNANYNFPTGNIDAEIDFFLTEAMEEAKAVADAIPLQTNSMAEQGEYTYEEFASAIMENPYAAMYSDEDLSSFQEVLMWRDYDVALNIRHGIAQYGQFGNLAAGMTRGLVDAFLMKNGLPIYADGSGYQGDDYISDVRVNRDGRLWLFLKEPGQHNVVIPSSQGIQSNPIEGFPPIDNTIPSEGYSTGYTSRKGMNYDARHNINLFSYYGAPVFRATEAYLNYIEASYEKNGNLDATAQDYWREIRERAGVDTDFQKTIAATNMAIEAENDWGAYSAGNFVDPTLYNIRRERRIELFDEGFRMMDLKRWRAMDQMISTPFHIEGFKIWGPMQEWYSESQLTFNIGDRSSVSAPELSDYLRLYQKTPTDLAFDGYRWHMAHYLTPIAIQHFLITTENNDVSQSPIYQNPGWPTTANSGPIDL